METKLMKYLTLKETADALGVSVRTLNRLHIRRMGPPRIKVGRNIRYRPEAVAEWMMKNEA